MRSVALHADWPESARMERASSARQAVCSSAHARIPALIPSAQWLLRPRHGRIGTSSSSYAGAPCGPHASLSTLCTVLITHWEKLGDEPLAGKVWVAYGTSMDTETTAAAAAALASSLWRHFCFPMAVPQLADVRDLADLSQQTALGPHLSSRCWLPLHSMPMSNGPMHRPVSIQALDFGMHCAAVQRWR